MTNNTRFAYLYDQKEEETHVLYSYPTDEYEDLMELISFEGFECTSATYANQEKTLLQPQLEALGYTEIIWLPGESDSFVR